MRWLNLVGALALTLLLGACGGDAENVVQQDPVCNGAAGETLCGTSCVDTSADVRHCGGCGITCSAGQLCQDGGCVLQCPSGQEICGTACHQLATSADHCGACGNACADGQACADGTCVDACPVHQTNCDGGCFDLGTSADHCGFCGDACGEGEVCSNAACVANCGGGMDACNGGCFDLASSRNHCGACDTACGPGEVCSEGACVINCPAGQTACDGGCFDTDTSYFHCGACGAGCLEGEACVDGACTTSCGGGLAACDGTCRDLQNDPSACGACGTVCSHDEICVAGICELHCASGLTACDDTCRNLALDRGNCGTCGTACAEGQFCVDGVCSLSCTGFNQDECDGACTNTAFDKNNCGACGIVCDDGKVCSDGSCVATCDPSTDLCPAGCTDLDIDPANCGACDQVCPAGPGMNAVCVAGSCANTCAEGFADCDDDPLNGCEIPTAADPNNCGGCGVSCNVANASASCLDGACVIAACTGDFVDCDGDPLNGCEAHLAQDSNNCSACGIQCAAGQSCVAATCVDVIGEDCNTPIQVTRGLNSIAWNAYVNNYLVTRSSCNTVTGDPTGGDIVLQYDAPAAGLVELHFVKQASNRYEAIVTDGACGSLVPQLACISDWSPAFMAGSFMAEAGVTYWIYVTDTTSGAAPLNNPLEMTLTHEYCDSSVPVAGSLLPEPGTTLADTRPEIRINFGSPVRADVGTVTLVGTGGTQRTIQLPSSEVTLSNGGRTLEVLPGSTFGSGEQLTVTATGLQDLDCGGGILTTPITWSFTLGTVPCSPGQGGMVGATMTRVPPNMAKFSLTESYVVPDQDPNGWVYLGGTTQLYRAAKNADRMPQMLHGSFGISSTQLGYALLLDGPNIYSLDSKTSGTSGHLYRLSSDGGATWSVTDVATFSQTPGDDFRGMAAHGGVIYLITSEGTSTQSTEIWTVSATGQLPASATLVASFGEAGNANGAFMFCSGIDVDAQSIYTICREGTGSTYALLRFDRVAPTVPVQVVAGLSGNTTVMALNGHDANGDGVFDFIYLASDLEQGQFVCNLGGTPYSSVHYDFGGTSGNYGAGLDRTAGAIWAYDDDTQEMVRFQ